MSDIAKELHAETADILGRLGDCVAAWPGLQPPSAKVEVRADLVTGAYVEIARLRQLVYVPGLWQCAKCKFQLVQANLNADDGSVTSRDQPGDRCPNCNVPLWRVSERDAGNDMVERCEEWMKRATAAEAELERLRRGS